VRVAAVHFFSVGVLSAHVDGRRERGKRKGTHLNSGIEVRPLFDLPFSVALGDVQWNRLSSAQPLIACVAMTTMQILGDCERG